jgi:uncharacterized protein YdhG (YjbR/CyaY superfamily)
MAKTVIQSVDEYIASHPEQVQKILQRVRSAVRKALPDAEECISYQIPTYKQHGAAVIYFAGFKEHFSLYPVGAGLVEAFGDEVAKRVVSKGTIRFPLSEPVPGKLIERIARFRAKETAARPEAKAQGSRSKPAAKKR